MARVSLCTTRVSLCVCVCRTQTSCCAARSIQSVVSAAAASAAYATRQLGSARLSSSLLARGATQSADCSFAAASDSVQSSDASRSFVHSLSLCGARKVRYVLAQVRSSRRARAARPCLAHSADARTHARTHPKRSADESTDAHVHTRTLVPQSRSRNSADCSRVSRKILTKFRRCKCALQCERASCTRIGPAPLSRTSLIGLIGRAAGARALISQMCARELQCRRAN